MGLTFNRKSRQKNGKRLDEIPADSLAEHAPWRGPRCAPTPSGGAWGHLRWRSAKGFRPCHAQLAQCGDRVGRACMREAEGDGLKLWRIQNAYSNVGSRTARLARTACTVVYYTLPLPLLTRAVLYASVVPMARTVGYVMNFSLSHTAPRSAQNYSTGLHPYCT